MMLLLFQFINTSSECAWTLRWDQSYTEYIVYIVASSACYLYSALPCAFLRSGLAKRESPHFRNVSRLCCDQNYDKVEFINFWTESKLRYLAYWCGWVRFRSKGLCLFFFVWWLAKFVFSMTVEFQSLCRYLRAKSTRNVINVVARILFMTCALIWHHYIAHQGNIADKHIIPRTGQHNLQTRVGAV